MTVLLLVALLAVLAAATVSAAWRYVTTDGGPRPEAPRPRDEAWHPTLPTRPYQAHH